MIQSMFLSVGRECGYHSVTVPCKQNGYPIPIVAIGRFIFTAHHAYSKADNFVPNSSFTRQQHSAINNEYLTQAQGTLFGPKFDASKVAEATEIRANILFGCEGDGLDFQNSGFLRIAVPSVEIGNIKGEENKVWLVENHDYFDILTQVSGREMKSKAAPIINVAAPKIKKASN